MERTLDQLLDNLKSELLRMGGTVEDSIAQAVRSMVDRDNTLSQQVIDGGDVVDDWEVRIEEECLRLLAMQQPVAGDLRLIATTMKINYDRSACCGHNRCYSLAPEIWDVDDEGYAILRIEGDIPAELEEKAPF